MIRALVILALAIGCSAKRPMILGERIPKECDKDLSADNERCVEYFVDKFLRLLMYYNHDDPAVARYVTSVGQRLARASGDRRAWKFVVLDTDEVNAFVTMGSTVYLQRGMLEVLRSEAELAAVLGHEMSHLLGGHARERWADLIRDAPRSAAERILQNRYARDDEIQADEHALLLLAKAGYDTGAVASMLRAIAGTTPYDATDTLDAVHPHWPERIARAVALASVHPGGTDLGETRYRAGLATLVAGKDPRREAVLIGRAAVISRANVAIDLPAGEIVPGLTLKVAVILADGARAEITSVPTQFLEFLKTIPSDDNSAFELETIGSATVMFSIEGKNARARAAELRAGKRKARPDELAQIRPRYVSFDAPRRLWSN